MDRQELMTIARRVARARSYEARIGELLRAAPEAKLNKYGLSHKSSLTGTIAAVSGAFVLGAGIGAGVALLFAPSSGKELRGKLQQNAKRMGDGVKNTAHKAEEKVQHARERIMSRSSYSGDGEKVEARNGH